MGGERRERIVDRGDPNAILLLQIAGRGLGEAKVMKKSATSKLALPVGIVYSVTITFGRRKTNSRSPNWIR